MNYAEDFKLNSDVVMNDIENLDEVIVGEE